MNLNAKPILTILLWLAGRLCYAQIPTHGLLAHFSFDNHLRNSRDASHVGKSFGAVFSTDRFNRPYHALALNGHSQYVSLGNHKSLKPTQGISVAVWAYRTDWFAEGEGHIFSNFEFAGSSISQKPTSVSATIKTTDGIKDISQSITHLQPGWHHFVFTFDGTSFKFFIDSQLVGESKTTSPATIEQHPNNHTFIGVKASRDDKPWVHESAFFEGMVDDLYVYDRALSHQEIIYLFEEAPPVPLKGFVFNKETGEKIAAEIEIDGNKVFCSKEKGYSTQLIPKAGAKKVHITAKGFFGKTDSIPAGEYPFEQNFSLEPIKINESVVLDNINFSQNSAAILPSSYPALDRIVELMKENPSLHIEIAGHTEVAGNPKANQLLSEKRAENVAKYLIDKGIDKSRVTSVGFGGTRPLTNETDEQSKSLNRRVEFKILSF